MFRNSTEPHKKAYRNGPKGFQHIATNDRQEKVLGGRINFAPGGPEKYDAVINIGVTGCVRVTSPCILTTCVMKAPCKTTVICTISPVFSEK